MSVPNVKLSNLTRAGLYEYAKAYGFVGHSSYTKDELLNGLRQAGIPELVPGDIRLVTRQFANTRLPREFSLVPRPASPPKTPLAPPRVAPRPASPPKTPLAPPRVAPRPETEIDKYANTIIKNIEFLSDVTPEEILKFREIAERLRRLAPKDAVKYLLTVDIATLELMQLLSAADYIDYRLTGDLQDKIYQTIEAAYNVDVRPSIQYFSPGDIPDLKRRTISELKEMAKSRNISIQNLFSRGKIIRRMVYGPRSSEGLTFPVRPEIIVEYPNPETEVCECDICCQAVGPENPLVSCKLCEEPVTTCINCYAQPLEIEPIPRCFNCGSHWNYFHLKEMGFSDEYINYIRHKFYGPLLLDRMRGRMKEIEGEALMEQKYNYILEYLRELHFKVRKITGEEQGKILKDEIRQMEDERDRLYTEIMRRRNIMPLVRTEQKNPEDIFRYQCPMDIDGEPCSGVIVNEVCTSCNKGICSKCEKEKIGTHACLSEDVQTVSGIREGTRPCPRCHCLIYKSEGCSQMFCTKCKTGFEWYTGEIVTKGAHNPHWIEWLNQQIERGIQRPVVCDEYPEVLHTTMKAESLGIPVQSRKIAENIHRALIHLYDNVLMRRYELPRDIQILNREELKAWASEELSEQEVLEIALKKDKNLEKLNEIRNMLLFARLVGITEIHNLINAETREDFLATLDRLENFRLDYNEKMRFLKSIFDNSPIFEEIPPDWNV